jgi:hypothetical protein
MIHGCSLHDGGPVSILSAVDDARCVALLTFQLAKDIIDKRPLYRSDNPMQRLRRGCAKHGG